MEMYLHLELKSLNWISSLAETPKDTTSKFEPESVSQFLAHNSDPLEIFLLKFNNSRTRLLQISVFETTQLYFH